MTSKLIPLLLAGLPLVLSACRENPELVRKREEQRAEIKRLEGEIALMEEKLKNIPETREEDLAKARQELEAQNQESTRLEQDISGLESRKRQLEKEFTDYKVKYRVANP
jgi:septal ring factor EnvC (AmiA/AmiB activator)